MGASLLALAKSIYYGQEPWVYKSRGLTPRISSFLYFRCILIGQRRLYPTCVSSDPDIKSEELLWVSAGSTFIKGALLFGYCNLYYFTSC